MKTGDTKHQGLFLTFEGIEGTGKTTQIRRAAEWLLNRGYSVVCTREPGGCLISDQIRAVLLDARNAGLHPSTELLLIVAARAQHVAEVLLPALGEGKIVLCDRFADATEAYQGFARGLGPDAARELSLRFTRNLVPDLTILLDMPQECAVPRARSRAERQEESKKEDRFEKENLDFHRRVREGYLAIARREPERVRVVDAAGRPEDVFSRIVPILAEKLGVAPDG